MRTKHRNIILTLMLLNASNSVAAVTDDSETLNIATRVVSKFDELKHFITVCKEQSINLELIEQQVNQQILAKTKLTYTEFRNKMLGELANFDTATSELAQQPCPEGASAGGFYFLESSLNKAVEKLAEATALQKSLDPELVPVKTSIKTRKPDYNEAYHQAASVVVGQLLPIEKIPSRYRDTFIRPNTKAKYVYHLEQGWKGTVPRYVIASDYGILIHMKEPTNEELKTKYLFYVDKNDFIFQKIAATKASKILKDLGKPDWYWSGGDLIKNKK